MQRKYVLLGLVATISLCLAMPAIGAPSPLSTAKKALKLGKSADKRSKSASKAAAAASKLAKAADAKAGTALTTANGAAAAIAAGVPKATNATNAETAKSADKLAGLTRFSKLVRVPVVGGDNDEGDARSEATPVTLGTAGPFTFNAKCFKDLDGLGNGGPADVVGEISVATNQDGAMADSAGSYATGLVTSSVFFDGSPAYLNTTTPEIQRIVDQDAELINNSSLEGDEETSTFVAPDGTIYRLEFVTGVKHGAPAGGDGPFGSGDGCLFAIQTLG